MSDTFKKIINNRKILIAVAFVLIVLIFVLIMLGKSKVTGYVTIDIDRESIKLEYNKDKAISVTGSNENVKNLKVTEALDKVLANYNDGTFILIGMYKADSEKIEKYLIEEYPGIDRHVIKIIYFDSNYLSEYKGNVSLGKYMLLSKLGILDKGLEDKTIAEILDYARENDLKANEVLYDLNELDNYHTRD